MKSEDLEHYTASVQHILTAAYIVFAVVLLADTLHWRGLTQLRELWQRFEHWKRQTEFEAFYAAWKDKHELNGQLDE